MVVVTAGTATDDVIISDNVTPASGTFVVYLNPQQITDTYQNDLIFGQAIGGDNSLGNSWGASSQTYVFKDCKWALSGAGGNMEKFKRALAYWSSEDSRPYLQVKDKNGFNQATSGVIDGASVTQWRCQIIQVVRRYTDAENHTFDVTVLRVTVPA